VQILRTSLLLILTAVSGSAFQNAARADDAEFTAEQLEFFENRVRPLLVEHCSKCHNAEEHKGNLVLDSRENLLKGGDTGPSIEPGNIEASELIKAVRYDPNGYQMPPDGKLDDAAIRTLEEWVGLGAPWPATAAAAQPQEEFNLAERAQYWSFQPLVRHAPPPVSDSTWPQTSIDRFLRARLEAVGLHPAPAADRATWIRRATFDTLGLPPTPAEVAEFVGDPAPDASLKVIERLLASPHFGERWGRHWLDLMRYAESRGHEFDYDVANPWHYRDYVIGAVNDDVPYDRFVIEHVAGDLLQTSDEPATSTTLPARFDPATGANESVVATGFWFLGEWVHSPVDIRAEEAERFANMIDVYSKSFLGLTVACARCHDHKFDPITQADFYALQGYLQSSVYRQALYESMDRNRRIARELDKLRDEATAALGPVLDEIAKPQASEGRSTASSVTLPEGAEVIVDYSRPDTLPLTDGGLFGTRAVQPGDVLLSDDPQRPVQGVATIAAVRRNPLWRDGPTADELDDPGRLAGWNRAGRTLRTPSFEIKRNKLWILIAGGCNTYVAVDSHVTINGPLHGALTNAHGPQPQWRWIEHDVSRYIGHRAHLEIVPRGDEPLEVAQVVQADTVPRLEAPPHSVWSDLLAKSDDPCLDWVRSESIRQQLAVAAAPFIARQRELLSQVIPNSAATPAMAAGTPEDEYVFIRGNWKKPGATIPRRFLEVFSAPGRSTPAHQPSTIDHPPSASSRFELAQQMVNPQDTPLLPRVIVNRIWQHYFGRGLVPTSDDFGHMGQPPSHPELLDWLATELVAHDWSLKHIHRLILLSSAYQMDSRQPTGAVAAATEVDPLNTLLHHMPVKRLEGEIVRDQLLSLSGRLDDRLYGRSVPIHLTAFLEGRGRPRESGPLDGQGRRSIYLSVRRNFPEPFLQAFDFPNPHTSIGRRSVSNVPAQALALMNNPFVIQQAGLWADQTLRTTPQAGVPERIGRLYQLAFSRPPTEAELAQGEAFLTQQAREYNVNVDNPSVWTDYCHVLINVKEFVFVR